MDENPEAQRSVGRPVEWDTTSDSIGGGIRIVDSLDVFRLITLVRLEEEAKAAGV